MRNSIAQKILQGGTILAVLFSAVFQPQASVHAAATLSIVPLTWNVVGLDSNNVNVGPDTFPVGAKVCNTGTETAANVNVDFNWNDTQDAYTGNSYINLRPDSFASQTLTELQAGACQVFYFEVRIARTAASYFQTRDYYITASSISGSSASTPTPREIYVEKLVSQNRNYTTGIAYSDYNATYAGNISSVLDNTLTGVPAGSGMNLKVGNRYFIRLYTKTATGGYNQLESFLTLSNTYFRINEVSSTYSAVDTSLNPVGSPSPLLYADSCGWDNVTTSPTYRSCIQDDGKSGNIVIVTYDLTIISGGGNTVSMNSLIYDFSGSSYHYNSDFPTSGATITVTDQILFSKSFTPASITTGQTSTLDFQIENVTANDMTGVSFNDTLPGSMTLNATITGTPLTGTNCLGTVTGTSGSNLIQLSAATIPANTTCSFSAVVKPPVGSYTNTTDPLFVGATSTGLTASDSLLVQSTTSGTASCSGDVVLAFWDFPTTSNIRTPAKSSGTDSNAIAQAGAGFTDSQLSVSDLIHPTGSGSWGESQGLPSSLDTNSTKYLEFAITTTGLSSVKLSFETNRVNNGGTNWALYYYVPGSQTPGAAPGVSIGSNLIFANTWTLNTLDTSLITNPVIQLNSNGLTYFRLFYFGGSTNSGNVWTYLDNVQFSTPCIPPQNVELSKSFASPVLAGSPSTLTFTLKNNNLYTLSGVTFTDLLPSGMTVASTTPVFSAGCAGAFSGIDIGDTSLSFSGTMSGGPVTCTVQIQVKAEAAGTYDNVTGFVSSTETGTNTTATGFEAASLIVYEPLVFNKTFSPNPVYAGEVSTLSFTISNPNNVVVIPIAFTDTLPAGMVVASPPNAIRSCGATFSPAAGSTSLIYSLTSIAAYQTCTAEVDVIAGSAKDYANTTSLDPGKNITILDETITASDTLSVMERHPGIKIGKQIATGSSGPWKSYMTITPNSNVYYRFTVENTGDVNLTGVQVTDPSIDLFSCPLSNPFTLTTAEPVKDCIVGPLTAQSGDILNTASVTGTYGGKQYTSSSTAEYLGFTQGGTNNATVTKLIGLTSNGPWQTGLTGLITGRDSVYYKFTVLNSGSNTLTNLSLADPNISLSGCTLSTSLAPGQATSCVVGPFAVSAGIHVNTASVSSSGTPLANSNTASYVASGATNLTITGTLWVDNNPQDGTVAALEPRISGATVSLYQWNGTSEVFLGSAITASDGSYSFSNVPSATTYRIRVTNGTAGYTLVSGPGFATGYIQLNSLAVNSAGNNFGYSIIPGPDLVITKSNNTSGSATVNIPFTWSLVVRNIGTTAAVFTQGDVVVSDTLPYTTNYSAPVYGSPTAVLSTGITNTGTGSVSCDISTPPALSCAVTGANGDTITIPAGESITISLPVTPKTTASLVNQAQVDPGNKVDEKSKETNNYSSTDIVGVNNELPDLIVTKTNDTLGSAGVGGSFVWTLNVRNVGYGAAMFTTGQVILRDTLPANATYGIPAIDPSYANITNFGNIQCPATAPSGFFECTAIGPVILGAGSSFSVNFTASPTAAASLANTGTVNYNLPVTESINTNNNDTDTVTSTAAPSLSLSKTNGVAGISAGSTTSYTLLVSNSGNAATSGTMTVIDTLPTGLSTADYASTTVGNWSCSAVSNVVTCTSSTSISANGSSTINLPAVNVDLDASGTITNLAKVGGGGDPSLLTPLVANVSACSNTPTPRGCATDSDPVTPQTVDLSLSKTGDLTTPNKGQNVTFTLTVTNSASVTVPATNIVVTDIVPSGYTYVAASIGSNAGATGATITPNAGSPAGTGLTWTINRLDPGESVTLTFQATVLPTGIYNNYAQISAQDQSDLDSVPGNGPQAIDEDDDKTFAVTPPSADLSLTKIVNNASPALGSNVIFTLGISNSGPDNAANVIVNDLLPAGLTFVSSSPSQGTYSNSTGDWTVGTVNSGATATLTITATVSTAGSKTNTAQVKTSDQTDPDSTPNNSSGTEDDQASVDINTLPVATIAVSPASVLEDGATDLIYTVTLDQAPAVNTTINLTLSGTATNTTDFTGSVASVTINAGSTTGTVTITPVTDTTVEANETVIFTIAVGTGYTVGTPSAATGTITDNDLPVATIAVSPASVLEDGATNLVYTVTLSQAPVVNTTINLTLSGTATNTTDFTGSVASVTINAGSTTGTVTITPVTDTTVEANETVIFTIAVGTGYTIGTPSAATGTITDNDLPVATIAVSPASVLEDGATNLVYTVTLSQAPVVNTTINLTLSGTATNTTDFTGSVASVTINAGSTTGTVTIAPVTDTTVEANETVIFTIAVGTGYTVGTPSAATGTITDNDLPVATIAVSPASVLEDGATNLDYTVTLSQAPLVNTTVNLLPSGTATNITDYTGSVTSVTINAGSTTGTFTINPATDTAVEGNETVIFTIQGGTGYTIGTPSAATGTITDDDLPVATISVSPVSVLEDGAIDLVFSVTLDRAPVVDVTVNLTNTGTATDGSDYTGTVASVTITAGTTTTTFTINPATDTTVEANENVIFTIQSGTGYTIGTPSAATGTITDDDLPVATITVSPASVLEDGAANLTYAVTLSQAPVVNTTVNLLPSGTATNITDYTGSVTSVTINAGSTTGTFTINPVTDTAVEGDETVIFTIQGGTGYTIGTPSAASGTITDDDGSNVFDPPSGYKTFNDLGLPEMEFRMVWINSGNTASINTQVTDDIPAGTVYVNGSLICSPQGTSTNAGAATAPLNMTLPNSFCAFDAVNNRIQWQGSIGPDNGQLTEATAVNEVVITFRVSVGDSTDKVLNIADARTDSNNDGFFEDDVLISASGNSSNQVAWDRTLSEVRSLPKTGFAPDGITLLPEQSTEKIYSATDLWLEIPSLRVKIPIVGVPLVDKEWDVSWLWQEAGWLNGTAFPGWSGNSALTSHVTLSNGKTGPFARLGDIKWGDKIIVRAYGSVYTYEVRENRTINPYDTSVLKHEEEAWITLLTCKTYNEKTGFYSSRIAVRAILLKVERDSQPKGSGNKR